MSIWAPWGFHQGVRLGTLMKVLRASIVGSNGPNVAFEAIVGSNGPKASLRSLLDHPMAAGALEKGRKTRVLRIKAVCQSSWSCFSFVFLAVSASANLFHCFSIASGCAQRARGPRAGPTQRLHNVPQKAIHNVYTTSGPYTRVPGAAFPAHFWHNLVLRNRILAFC